jgi:hypothetical protein
VTDRSIESRCEVSSVRRVRETDVMLREEYVPRVLIHATHTQRRFELATNQLDQSRFA